MFHAILSAQNVLNTKIAIFSLPICFFFSYRWSKARHIAAKHSSFKTSSYLRWRSQTSEGRPGRRIPRSWRLEFRSALSGSVGPTGIAELAGQSREQRREWHHALMPNQRKMRTPSNSSPHVQVWNARRQHTLSSTLRVIILCAFVSVLVELGCENRAHRICYILVLLTDIHSILHACWSRTVEKNIEQKSARRPWEFHNDQHIQDNASSENRKGPHKQFGKEEKKVSSLQQKHILTNVASSTQFGAIWISCESVADLT